MEQLDLDSMLAQSKRKGPWDSDFFAEFEKLLKAHVIALKAETAFKS